MSNSCTSCEHTARNTHVSVGSNARPLAQAQEHLCIASRCEVTHEDEVGVVLMPPPCRVPAPSRVPSTMRSEPTAALPETAPTSSAKRKHSRSRSRSYSSPTPRFAPTKEPVSGVPFPVLHTDWLERRPQALSCGHTLRNMEFNCGACQSEYVDAEQAQMIVRPEGEPPLEIYDSTPVDGSYRWDFISRYIQGFRHQLAARGKDGYSAQRRQYLSAEAARCQRSSSSRHPVLEESQVTES